MATYTLTQHMRDCNDDDDSKSNVSSVSSVRIAQPCPCCKKEIQARFMFNHLRKLHPEFVKSMYGVWKDEQMDELIKTNAPFPVEWTMKDDFDDDIAIMMWGCLGCNNTYTTEHNAKKHCQGKCKKEHNVNLRKIKKEEQQDREKHQKKISTERLRWLNRTPEQIYSCIQQDLAYYEKKWNAVGDKIVRYLQLLNHENPQKYYYNMYEAKDIMFVDDKKKMEVDEKRLNRMITQWKRDYEDVLPLLWGATDVVSHAEYDALEKQIMHFQDHECKF